MKWNSALRLRIHELADEQIRLLPEDVRKAIQDGSIELETLLQAGSKAQLRVVVTAAHSYTFGRTFALRRFAASAVKAGPFDRLEPRVNTMADAIEDDVDAPPTDADPTPAAVPQ